MASGGSDFGKRLDLERVGSSRAPLDRGLGTGLAPGPGIFPVLKAEPTRTNGPAERRPTQAM